MRATATLVVQAGVIANDRVSGLPPRSVSPWFQVGLYLFILVANGFLLSRRRERT